MPLISAARVTEIFMECHWKDAEMVGKSEEEMVAQSTVVKTISVWVGFNPERVKSFREEIAQMLLNLEPDFLESGEERGMSFLRAPLDKDGNQWGEQQTADRLLALGMALEWVSFPLPRETWRALPGGVPYVIVHDNKIKADLENKDEVR